MAIKILIADDHALLRQGIKRVLNFEDDLEVVGEASEGQEALSRTLVLQPDILLIDLNMPGLNGIEVLRRIRKTSDMPNNLFLTPWSHVLISYNRLSPELNLGIH